MKKLITVTRFKGYCRSKAETYSTEILAEIHGPFGIFKDPYSTDKPWAIIHVGTGLGVTYGDRYLNVARRIARALEAQPGWDFTTQAEFAPRCEALAKQLAAAREAAEVAP